MTFLRWNRFPSFLSLCPAQYPPKALLLVKIPHRNFPCLVPPASVLFAQQGDTSFWLPPDANKTSQSGAPLLKFTPLFYAFSRERQLSPPVPDAVLSSVLPVFATLLLALSSHSFPFVPPPLLPPGPTLGFTLVT